MCLSSGEHVFSLVVVPKKVGAKMRRVVVGGNGDGVGGWERLATTWRGEE